MIEKRVSIIGMGALGTVLAGALYEQGVELYSLFNRSEEPLNEVASRIKPVYSGRFPESVDQLGDLIFITTSDDAIKLTTNRLTRLHDNYSGNIIAHCSGTETSSALSALQSRGASVAAFHPIQTFTARSDTNDFNEIFFDLEGDQRAVDCLKGIAEALDARCFEVNPQAKPYLHAAGVTASNYLVALLEMAAVIAEMGDIDRKTAVEALLPLAQKSLDHVRNSAELKEALSGPVRRGDDGTVQKHLSLLEDNQDIQQLYQNLGKLTLKVAAKADLPPEKQKLLKKLFDDE